MKKTLSLLLVLASAAAPFVGCGDPDGTTDEHDFTHHCFNGVLDADEADVDCGGIRCNDCPIGTPCNADYDCDTSYCYDRDDGAGLVCISPETAPPCDNRVQDGDETDIDCGGSCAPCAANRYCASDADCASADCVEVTAHPDGVVGQCWDDGYSGCTPVVCESSNQVAACGNRILVMCQEHLPAAMIERCNDPLTTPMVTDAHLVCCDAAIF